MTTDTWDPTQYDKFAREREQPFFDLLALVRPVPAMRVVDLGCGTGTLTRRLHEQLAAAETIGLDRSGRMLAVMRDTPQPPGLGFETGTIEAFARGASAHPRPGSSGYDLVFSNAALHWVDDHAPLIARLASALAPGGQLAFQVPAQHDTLTHRLAEELAREEPFASAFGGWRRAQPVLTPDAYARLLHGCGFGRQQVHLIVYPHVLASRDQVVEWVKGTMLTEYKRHLPEAVYDRFVDAYRGRLLAQLPDDRPFFYPFKRILCWGQRSA
jgi:trans-aconitate 2-methyltransferase